MTATRRKFLAGSAMAAGAALMPGAGIGASPLVTVTSRQIEVLGRAVTVFGVFGADGRPGFSAREGERLSGTLRNESGRRLTMHWHGQVLAPWEEDRARPGGGFLKHNAEDAHDFALTPGTHWMHAHDLAEQQLLAAPMVTREAAAPEVQEHVVMLHDFAFRPPEEILAGLGGLMAHGGHGASGGEAGMAGMDHAAMMPGMVHANDVDYDAFLANERTLDDPEAVQVEAGAQVRLRIINGATATAFWIDTGALPSTCIAVDGSPCEPLPGRRFPLAQGQRVDLLCDVPQGGGAFPVFAQLEASHRRTGLILATPGAAVERLADEAETVSDHLGLGFDTALRALRPLRERPARMIHVALGEEPGYRWTLNGRVHGEHEPLGAALGERVALMFMNPTSMMHPMHLHGHHFQVVDVGQGRFAGPMRDTVIVPPGGMVTVEAELDKPGAWFLHCHHLYHMATGMMTELVVG
jgi:FtsP/CotA-like multicopper oxidase with cupredoxin domain